MSAALMLVSLDRAAKESLQSQLVRQMWRLILERRIAAGEKLPSSRSLAEELSVSRVTVTAAIDQLVSEGYAEGRRGSGVYVAEDLPDYVPRIGHEGEAHFATPHGDPEPPRPFEVGVPDLQSFPYREWARLLDRAWRAPESALLAKPDPFGWGPLRSAIAAHLRDWRGISCLPAQIVVTSGIVETVDLIAAVALAAGDQVVVEEPGYDIVRRALRRNDVRWQASRVDAQGFDIHKAIRTCPEAKAVVVTPSRQYPLGMTLPLVRRLELLDWAPRAGGYIIEDDYDSEYRYQGQPLPALMSLDDRDRVIYVGSFSKVLFSTLRLGFVVLPMHLIDAAGTALSQFMDDGSFAKHLRRMRRPYVRRQAVLVEAIRETMDDLLDAAPTPAGMYLVARFRPGLADRMTDGDASALAATHGVTAKALSSFYDGTRRGHSLVFGYAGFDEDRIKAGVDALHRALR